MTAAQLATLSFVAIGGCYQSHEASRALLTVDPERADWCPTFVDVQSGNTHACGLTDTGEVLCALDALPPEGDTGLWDMGQAGSTTVDENGFARPGVDNAVQIVAGERHTCARLSTGAVKCWGFNASGQLGDGTRGVTEWNVRTRPVDVLGVQDSLELFTADSATFSREASGDFVFWGNDVRSAQSWNVSAPGRSESAPVPLSVFSGADRLKASDSRICGLYQDGSAECLGRNRHGELGRETAQAGDPEPAFVTVVGPIADIAIGLNHTCAVERGTVHCFGSNDMGQLGSNAADTVTPNILEGITDVIAVETSGQQTCALRASGQVLCWGQTPQFGPIPNGIVAEGVVRMEFSSFSLTLERASGEIAVLGRVFLPCTGLED